MWGAAPYATGGPRAARAPGRTPSAAAGAAMPLYPIAPGTSTPAPVVTASTNAAFAAVSASTPCSRSSWNLDRPVAPPDVAAPP
ncbi:hypothetical protein G6F50_018195 [Rhizopus delemar]|uniref:Uncharacterized protein n=1 Tax=Rhizopus delemar TaxID=936053 RepID=A0A9P7BZ55_9FUNG|nr:hypothetical protein G6F50_018195 [Rhizopus delemar]